MYKCIYLCSRKGARSFTYSITNGNGTAQAVALQHAETIHRVLQNSAVIPTDSLKMQKIKIHKHEVHMFQKVAKRALVLV